MRPKLPKIISRVSSQTHQEVVPHSDSIATASVRNPGGSHLSSFVQSFESF